MIRTAVIMAGGSGERFWPLSRKRKPKQLLSLGKTEKSMIQESVDRASRVISPENIFIITSEILAEPIRDALSIPRENVIPEPAKRNTAPCLALSAAFINEKFGVIKSEKISMAVLTADHIMEPQEKFEQTLDAAMTYVELNEVIATIGITPTRPETGYGYIQKANGKLSLNETNIYEVVEFKEKPNLETAEKYIESGDYLWNSGMFFWRLDTFIEQMKKHLPSVGDDIENLSACYEGQTNIELKHQNALSQIFSSFPDISIDYGLMEKADSVVVVESLFEWDDIGDLNSLDRTKKADENGNILIGANSVIKSNNCILINETDNEKVISTIGMHNVVVVLTNDAVLVCDRDRVQDVKLSVKDIRERFGEEWL